MEPYRFTGPQGTSRKYGPNKGIIRAWKEKLHQEALERQKRYLAGESRNPFITLVVTDAEQAA